jgi:tetratricopeptide (TPR) repeat protein
MGAGLNFAREHVKWVVHSSCDVTCFSWFCYRFPGVPALVTPRCESRSLSNRAIITLSKANSADTLGWAYYHNSAFSVAAPLLEEAVKKVPLNATYRYHLGLIYQKLNNSNRAPTELEKAISIDPNSSIASKARQALGDTPRT